jgi:hypothetical protein
MLHVTKLYIQHSMDANCLATDYHTKKKKNIFFFKNIKSKHEFLHIFSTKEVFNGCYLSPFPACIQ